MSNPTIAVKTVLNVLKSDPKARCAFATSENHFVTLTLESTTSLLSVYEPEQLLNGCRLPSGQIFLDLDNLRATD